MDSEKALEYWRTFDEPFPMMLVMGMGREEVERLIQECLDKGKPYEYEGDNTY